MFGKKYVTVVGKRVNIGSYKIEKERLFCSFNKRVEMDGKVDDGEKGKANNKNDSNDNKSGLTNKEQGNKANGT